MQGTDYSRLSETADYQERVANFSFPSFCKYIKLLNKTVYYPFLFNVYVLNINSCLCLLKINKKRCQLCYQTDLEVAKHHVSSGHTDKHHSSHADKHHGGHKQTNLSSLEVKGEKVNYLIER